MKSTTMQVLAGALIGAVVAGALVAAVPAFAQEPPKGDAAHGKQLYIATGCFECHGRAGQGGAFNTPAPRLAQTQLPFEGFEGQLRNPTNDMPAYSEQAMPQKDVADIYAFVRALPGPRKDITLMNN